MTDAPLQSDEEATTVRSGPPPIVVVESAAGSNTLSCGMAIVSNARMLIIMPAMMIAVFLFLHCVSGELSAGVAWFMIVVQTLVFTVLYGRSIRSSVRDWRIDREMFAKDGGDRRSDESSIVTKALLEVGGLVRPSLLTDRPRRATVGRFQQLLRDAGLRPALVIVQVGLEVPLRAIPTPSEFVEPERLLLGTMQRRSMTFIFNLLLLAFAVWVLVNSARAGHWMMTAFISIGLAVLGMQILKSFGVHVSEGKAPVMGMGVFSDHKGRRWSVQDSCVYLWPMKQRLQSFVVAELVGPDGYHRLFFHGLDDPALRMFWQRWMHPHPRPDLV